MKTTRTQTLFAAALVGALTFATGSIAAQERGAATASPAEKPTASDSLSQAASDPTASLMSVQLADWYTARFHGLGSEDANTVVLRSAIPFKTGDLNHIFRVTVPFITDHPVLDAGLSDITIFDLMVFDQSWGRFQPEPLYLRGR